jgi:uncharacterized protein involved in exopolysaccharide biosynthesis
MEQVLSDWLKKTIELLAGEKRLAEIIVQLTAAQAKLLEPGQEQELLSLINQRQKCIDDLISINAELLTLETKILNMCGLESRPSGKTLLNPEWQKIASLRLDIKALLREAQSLDNNNRKAIANRCVELKKAMQSISARRSSFKSYHVTAAQAGGYFIDHKK